MLVLMLLLAFGLIAVGIVAVVYFVALSPRGQRRRRRSSKRARIDLFTAAAQPAPAVETRDDVGVSAS